MNDFVQKIKLENNDELINLHSTISSLRDQLENQQFLKNKEIQESIHQTADEIKQLQLTITEQRNQLDKLKFEKKEAIALFYKKTYSSFATTREAFVPPKPKEFDKAFSTFRSRA